MYLALISFRMVPKISGGYKNCELRHVKQLEEENTKIKRMNADLTSEFELTKFFRSRKESNTICG